MTDSLTPQVLRAHAEAEDSWAWQSQARTLLKWAADTLEAAQAVIDERQPHRDRAGQK